MNEEMISLRFSPKASILKVYVEGMMYMWRPK